MNSVLNGPVFLWRLKKPGIEIVGRGCLFLKLFVIKCKNDKFWRKFKISCHINQQKPYSKRVSLRFFVALNYLKRDSNGIIMVKFPRVRGLTIKSKQHTVYCNIGKFLRIDFPIYKSNFRK
jgi:hypothetical protein